MVIALIGGPPEVLHQCADLRAELVAGLHRLEDLSGSFVRQSIGLTAVSFDDVTGLIELRQPSFERCRATP